jgi:hypothetical protein
VDALPVNSRLTVGCASATVTASCPRAPLSAGWLYKHERWPRDLHCSRHGHLLPSRTTRTARKRFPRITLRLKPLGLRAVGSGLDASLSGTGGASMFAEGRAVAVDWGHPARS